MAARSASWTILADFSDQCGEAPLWVAREQALYWVDNIGRRVLRWDTVRGPRVVQENLDVFGLALAREGFVVTNQAGVWQWQPGAAPARLAETGDPLPLNDCFADPAGRLFTGAYVTAPGEKRPLARLYRFDPDGRIHVLDEGVRLSNGIGLSLDRRTLYWTDSLTRTIHAYDYTEKTGDLSRRRIFVQVPADQGLPDGLTVDAAGFVWSAQWFGGRVVRYDPDGHAERVLELPCLQPSSLCFGGPDYTRLFVTSAAVLEEIDEMPTGYRPGERYRGGALYATDLELQGRPPFTCRLQPAS